MPLYRTCTEATIRLEDCVRDRIHNPVSSLSQLAPRARHSVGSGGRCAHDRCGADSLSLHTPSRQAVTWTGAQSMQEPLLWMLYAPAGELACQPICGANAARRLVSVASGFWVRLSPLYSLCSQAISRHSQCGRARSHRATCARSARGRAPLSPRREAGDDANGERRDDHEQREPCGNHEAKDDVEDDLDADEEEEEGDRVL